jgi:hypothetical protein
MTYKNGSTYNKQKNEKRGVKKKERRGGKEGCNERERL